MTWLNARTRGIQIPGIDRSLVINLHADHDQYISEEIATFGEWEPLETEVVRRLVRADELFVDCGANIGWYTLAASASGVAVLAFEPEPHNVDLLRENVRVNGLEERVEVHAVALGDADGVVRLQLSETNQGDHRVAANPVGSTVEVPVARLDDVLAGRPACVIKLDTQGSEVAILRGARRTLASPASARTTLILEYWPFGLQHCGASAEELIGLLTTLVGTSHDCFELVETRGGLRPITLSQLATMAQDGDYSPEGQGHTNLVLVPRVSLTTVEDLILSEPAPVDQQVTAEVDAIAAQLRTLARAESSASSQNGEDGVLAWLIGRMQPPQVIIEMGAGSGIECNSRHLRELGWHAIAFDGDPEGSDWVRRAFLTAENLNEVIATAGPPAHIGVLTIDLDGNDFWLLQQLDERYLPNVLVAEYNATLGPVDHLTVSYQPRRRWDHSNYFGCSLAALTLLLHERGLELVYCESTGVNAFFVDRTLLDRAGLVAVPAHRAYMPPQYGLQSPLGEHTGHLATSRRFVRVDSIDAAQRAYRATLGSVPASWFRRFKHRATTGDTWRFRRTWFRNRLATLRGDGPTK